MSAASVPAVLVPGMPHLLAARDPNPGWSALARATGLVGQQLRDAGVETLVMMSTQWFTVLGHQLQADPRPRGTHVDENWYAYDFGSLTYDLRVDTDVVERWAQRIDDAGMQSRLTHYRGFPIDTGTIVATRLIDPGGSFRLALVSCNLYAAPEVLRDIGALGLAAAGDRRAALVAVSGTSAGLIQEWIDPDDDRIADPEHERWNDRILGLLADGDMEAALALREEYARAAQVDAQGRWLAWLAAADVTTTPASVLARAPVWGTGAAVVTWGLT